VKKLEVPKGKGKPGFVVGPGLATHYAASDRHSACGIVGARHMSCQVKDVDCLRCRCTGSFKADRIRGKR